MKAVVRVLLLLVCLAFGARADEVDRSDPNFVTVSLLIMGPGQDLFSCAGHACLRLECPTFKLDYCFSYESEGIRENLARFFAGNLKMGMFAVPTKEYLNQFVEAGRGVFQYRLALPPDVKQRLWKIMDDKVAEGVNIPYDYLNRGCAWSVLTCLNEAVKPLVIKPPEWATKYEWTRREVVEDTLIVYPWNRFFAHSLCGSELDRNVRKFEKILLPGDLLAFLQGATLVQGGQVSAPIAASVPVELMPQIPRERSWTDVITPMVLACLVLALAVVNFFLPNRYLAGAVFSVEMLGGLFFTFLIFISKLPATDWNWLIIPFNLLPLLFWRWRKHWCLPFAALLAVWDVLMLVSPHRLTDPSHLVLTLAFILLYVRMSPRIKFFR